jgi:hypothetical protein
MTIATMFHLFIEKTRTMKKIKQEISKGRKINKKETNLEINHNDHKLSKKYFKKKQCFAKKCLMKIGCKKGMMENDLQNPKP